MIGIYKAGGPHKKDGVNFYFDAVSNGDLQARLDDGWVTELESIKPKPKATRKPKASADVDNQG